MSFNANIFPMNSLAEDPNLRGSSPLVVQLIDFSETLVSGIAAIDNIGSKIEADDVVGAHVYMKSGDDDGDLTGVSLIEAGSTSGLKVTLVSSLSTSTAAKVGTIALLGRITPKAV